MAIFIAPSTSKHKTETNSTLGKPVISGSASKVELQAAAARYGWTRRELTAKEIRGEMSSGEVCYHEVCNPEQFEAAFQREAIGVHNSKEMTKVAANRIWDDKATPAETEAAMRDVAKFTTAYPQFRGAEKENRDRLLNYLRERSEVVTFKTLVAAFEALALQGAIALNPNAINCGAETYVTGKDLLRHHSFHLLLQRQNRLSEVDRQSADQYLEANKDTLADRRTPPMILARHAKAAATEAFFGNAQAATASSGSTTVVDYPAAEPSGYQTHSKFAFKNFVKNLSAAEFQEKLNDPTFVAALDHSADGNK